jgi:hypothetical protein
LSQRAADDAANERQMMCQMMCMICYGSHPSIAWISGRFRTGVSEPSIDAVCGMRYRKTYVSIYRQMDGRLVRTCSFDVST